MHALLLSVTTGAVPSQLEVHRLHSDDIMTPCRVGGAVTPLASFYYNENISVCGVSQLRECLLKRRVKGSGVQSLRPLLLTHSYQAA